MPKGYMAVDKDNVAHIGPNKKVVEQAAGEKAAEISSAGMVVAVDFARLAFNNVIEHGEQPPSLQSTMRR